MLYYTGIVAELDHIFVCTSDDADHAARLVNFGLTEGTPNVHPGQGTACRRFFLANTYIELVWINDPTEAQSEAVRQTHLWERWIGRANDACPFGMALRPTAGRLRHSG